MDEQMAKLEMKIKRAEALASHTVRLCKDHNYDKDSAFLTMMRKHEIHETALEIADFCAP